MNTIDARLVAIDADTGASVRGFGKGGFVDLKEGLGVDDPTATSSPPRRRLPAPPWWLAAAWRTTSRPTCRVA
jgi:hypothetical protein